MGTDSITESQAETKPPAPRYSFIREGDEVVVSITGDYLETGTPTEEELKKAFLEGFEFRRLAVKFKENTHPSVNRAWEEGVRQRLKETIPEDVSFSVLKNPDTMAAIVAGVAGRRNDFDVPTDTDWQTTLTCLAALSLGEKIFSREIQVAFNYLGITEPIEQLIARLSLLFGDGDQPKLNKTVDDEMFATVKDWAKPDASAPIRLYDLPREYFLLNELCVDVALNSTGLTVGNRASEISANVVGQVEKILRELETYLPSDPQAAPNNRDHYRPAGSFKPGYYAKTDLTVNNGQVVPTVDTAKTVPVVLTDGYTPAEYRDQWGISLVFLKSASLPDS